MQNSVVRFFFLFLFLTCSSACRESNIQKIQVHGQVINELEGKPIAQAKVLILCWYKAGFDEENYEKVEVITNADGKFKASFQEGFKIEVASVASGYNPVKLSEELADNTFNANLSLNKIKDNLDLEFKHRSESSLSDTSNARLFLGVRISSDNSGEELDFTSTTTYGFDLKSFRLNKNLDSTDFWFEKVSEDMQPHTLVAHKNGGLIPIYFNDIKSSLFFEKDVAPETGYLSKYILTGEEAGLFVKSRDGKTFAKIIFEYEEDTTGPNGKGGFYKELGRNFTVMYQPNGTRNLAYSNPNIDLLDFLMTY